MGRHSLPDEHGPDDTRSARDDTRSARPPMRTRTVVITTALVLAVAAGTTYAARSGIFGSGSCGDGTVRLGVVASPDIAPALRAAAAEVRRTGAKSDGNCLDVRVTARDSAPTADAFATGRGTEGYQVWIPDADMWPQRVRGSGSAPLTAAGNVASSPLGVATVPTAGKTLGWPGKTYTWAELTAATTSGHAPRLGTADPSRSATGLIALTSVGQSASTSDPEGTKTAAVAKMLSKRMSDSEGRLLNTLARDDSPAERDDPRRNQALFLSEQAAFTHNAAGRTPRLQLFYPKDGTALLDYPYTLIDEPGMTTDQSRAAMRFQAFLGQSDGRRVLARHGFRAPGRPADEKVVRTAGGSAPQPYVRTADAPPATKAVEETLGMWTITLQSARLTTVVDASGSMAALVPGSGGKSRMDVTKTSLAGALSQFTDEDEVGLWKFATNLDGARDYRKLVPTSRLGSPVPGGGTHRTRLTAAFNALRPDPNGATGLYDTTLAAYEDAQAGYSPGRFNAVVILTDGSNQDSVSLSRSTLIARLRTLADPQRPVPLIAIAVGPEADQHEVQEIAEATGGGGYQVNDPAEIHSVILKAITESSQTP